MNEPTQEQIRELWEWCGGLEYSRLGDTTYEVYFPDGGVVKCRHDACYPL